MDSTKALIFSAAFILIGVVVTVLLRKRLSEKKFKSIVTLELAALLLIPVGYLLVHPDSWFFGIVEFLGIPFTIWGFVELFRGNMGKGK